LSLSGPALLLGSSGPIGVQYRVLSSTNAALPMADWTPILTNKFLSNGMFSFTTPATNAQTFFRLVSP
jgi:hypothetical protein